MDTKLTRFGLCVLAFLICGAPCAAESVEDFTLNDLAGTPTSTETLRQDKVLVLKFGATWCGYCRQQTQELTKLRQDFDPGDLVIVDVYAGENAETVAPHAEGLPFTILLDEDGAVTTSYDVTGIPVVIVVDPTGKIVHRGNYIPRTELRETVKSALAAREIPPAHATTAGKAQTECPVMGGPINKTIFADYKGHRVYFCCAGCSARFTDDPDKYIKQMADQGVAPEQVAVLCPKCGQIKGTKDCCKAGQTVCSGCGLAKGSPGCCKIAKDTTETVTLCRECGNIAGSAECTAHCGSAKASCSGCRRCKGSPGCCKSDTEIAETGLCSKCGHKKGSAECCNRQGKELCAKCGLAKGSAGCCKIT